MESDSVTAAEAAEPRTRETPAAKPSLRKLAIRTGLWTVGGDGAASILRIASQLILTRLLVPEMFGVMALVNVLMLGLHMFSDIGIRPSIIQSKRGDDPAFLNTAWTLQAIRGALLWACSCLMAWPMARFYGQPLILQVLPVLGLTALIDGFASTKLVTCGRHLAIGPPTVIAIGADFIGVVVTIAWAWWRPSVWAFVGGALAGTAARVVLSHVALKGVRNRLRWDAESRRELIHFGRWVFLSTLSIYFAMQADRLIFGAMVPVGLLGVYSIGAMLIRWPAGMVHNQAMGVGLPAFSRVHQSEGGFARPYRRLRLHLLVGGGAMAGFFILLGPPVVRLLYPPRFQEAGWVVQLVALESWMEILGSCNVVALLALGKPKWIALANLTKIAAMVVILPLAFRAFGFPGAVAGLALAEVPRYLVLAGFARRNGLDGWGTEAGMSFVILLCGLAAVGIHYGMPASFPSWAKSAIGACCFGALWLPLAVRSFRMERGPA